MAAANRRAPRWRKSPPDLVRCFEAVLPDDPRVELRVMFGYPAAFANGHLFAGLHQADLMLRLADEARARLLALPGARHFEPLPGRRMRAYAVVPRSLHADRRALRRWMAQAFADALSLPPKRGARPR